MHSFDPRHWSKLNRQHECLTPFEQIREVMDRASYANWLKRKAEKAFGRRALRVAEFWFVRYVQRCGYALGMEGWSLD